MSCNTTAVTLIKEGSRGEFGNYRPVGLTSVVGKVLETLIKERIWNHLNNFKLIKGTQYELTKGSSFLKKCIVV